MTSFSINVNKVATLRNARGGNVPDLLQFAQTCERFGVDGITVHPRPDERHIRRTDVYELKRNLKTEFNIEGYPSEDFISLIEEVRPTQVTLVPDAPDQLTSDHGWDTIKHFAFLHSLIQRLHALNVRVSVFVDPQCDIISKAKEAGADRVELYTGPYAEEYEKDKQQAIARYHKAANRVREIGLGMNAGHDLNLHNLKDFVTAFPWTLEVSIGQAVIADALYLGIEETIRRYKACLS